MHRFLWLKTEIIELYMNIVIRSFAIGMAGIFIPIYLYQLGFTIKAIMFFYMVTFASLGICSLFIAQLRNLGLKHIILLSMPFQILFILLLFLLDHVSIPLMVTIGVITGLANALYWVPLHALFAKYSQTKKVTMQTSYMFSLPGAASIGAPLLGGFIIATLGFKALLFTVSLMLLCSAVPLFYTKDIKPGKRFHWSQLGDSKYRSSFWGFFIFGFISIAGGILWPLSIFLLLKNVILVGTAGTFSALGVVTFPLLLSFAKKYISLHDLFRISGILSFGILSAIPFAITKTPVYAVSFIIGIMLVLTEAPFYSHTIKLAKHNPLAFMIYREIALACGRLTFLSILILSVNAVEMGFIVAKLASLVYIIL